MKMAGEGYDMFIGGKQARPDQGYNLKVLGPDGQAVGEVLDLGEAHPPYLRGGSPAL